MHRQLNGLFHLDSKRSCLSRRRRIVCCRASFGSIHHSLVITFLFFSSFCYSDLFSAAESHTVSESAFYQFTHAPFAVEVQP